jgi:hypothetical protein
MISNSEVKILFPINEIYQSQPGKAIDHANGQFENEPA